jgi:hypothetical protein
LYQTKDISTFKLWGIILNNLQYDKENDLVWSILTREDFKKTDADRKDLEKISDTETFPGVLSVVVQKEFFIEDFLKEVEEDPEYNIDEPEIIDLLDTDDGYNWQTYIQNDLENGIFIYWEGFSKYCWKAFCRKYPFKKKENIIQMFIDTRAKDLAKDFGYELIDADYFIAEDENAYGNEFKDYILKLTYKKI